MGNYRCGDVILVCLSLPGPGAPKTRPAVILGSDKEGNLIACPVSHKPPSDSASIPLSLDDFREGGLDLFEDSYILLAHPVRLRSREVIAKKGRIREDLLIRIIGMAEKDAGHLAGKG